MERSHFPSLLLGFLLGLSVGIVGTYVVLRPIPTEPQPTASDTRTPAPTPGPPAQPAKSAAAKDEAPFCSVCSFNIQFLGHFKKRDDEALAAILKDYEIVVIQELVAPPVDGTYPNGESYSADLEAVEFFQAMNLHGFTYWLSDEDTGTNDEIHSNGSGTEWWVVFFKPDRVEPAADLPHGFLADDRPNHDDWERVPYAFALRTAGGEMDFVLVSVHLEQGDSAANASRRHHELASIARWVDVHDEHEKDFIILGDMNIEDADELGENVPPGYVSLNDECWPTNTLVTGPKPYDHVLFRPVFTGEIDSGFDIQVINLIEAMRPFWSSPEPYPGGPPYNHNDFKQYYSDHHPVVFRMVVPSEDDD